MKKINLWIKVKKWFKKHSFINDIFVPIYRNLKHLNRKMYFKIKEPFLPSDQPNPDKIYWIAPKTIRFHTNYKPNKFSNFEDRVFNMKKYKGAVIGGNWDSTNYNFEDLPIYKALKSRIFNNVDWCNTAYYQNLLKDIKQGYSRYSCTNESELVNRFEKLDVLIKNIKKEGYKSSKEIHAPKNKNSFIADEITVNIGRNGEYLFQNGRHRLSIALLLGIKKIPVQVLVRHKNWIQLRKSFVSIIEKRSNKLYQPAFHPDLIDIPASHDCVDRFNEIKKIIMLQEGTLLDIGTNLGHFCYKCEEEGFQCTGIEKLLPIYSIAEKMKKSVHKKYKLVAGDILNPHIQKQIGSTFDVVLFLNILHHFLKEEKTYHQMTQWLKSLKTQVIFFEPHLISEEQMQNAYINYNTADFLEYIMKNTGKTKHTPIYKAPDGRTVFMLT